MGSLVPADYGLVHAAGGKSPQLSTVLGEVPWREALRQVQEELGETMLQQVGHLRQELLAVRSLQHKLQGEHTTAVRREVHSLVKDEHDGRAQECMALRSLLLTMQARMAEGQAVSVAPGSHGHSLATTEMERELDAERESRCARDAELHARIGREVGDIFHQLEQQRVALAEEIADVRALLVDQHSQFERALERERSDRSRELLEVHAIQESLWKRIGSAQPEVPKAQDGKSYFFRYETDGEEPRYKQCVGDQEDINALYEMVQEAIGNSVHLKEQIATEQALRARHRNQVEKLERQVTTLQALVRNSTAGAATSVAPGDLSSPPSDLLPAAPFGADRADTPVSAEIPRAMSEEPGSPRQVPVAGSGGLELDKRLRLDMQQVELFRAVDRRLEASEAQLRQELSVVADAGLPLEQLEERLREQRTELCSEVGTRLEASEALLRSELRACMTEVIGAVTALRGSRQYAAAALPSGSQPATPSAEL